MAPRIAGFRTRAQLGLRPPRSISRNINPERGGCAPHWGGPAPRIRNHADCEQTWRNYQNFHMDSRKWTDVAYTAGYCQHGYVLAGRGLGVRTAAQGTNAGNQTFHAFVWIGGVGMVPTRDAFDALEWLIDNARKNGTGMRVVPHRAFTGSLCPGDEIIAHVRPLDGRPITGAPTEPEEDDMKFNAQQTKELQHLINRWINESGGWAGTKLSALQVDGVWGTKSSLAAWHALERIRLRAPEATRPNSLYVDHKVPSPVMVGYITAAITARAAA